MPRFQWTNQVAFIHVSFVFPPARNVIRENDVLKTDCTREARHSTRGIGC